MNYDAKISNLTNEAFSFHWMGRVVEIAAQNHHQLRLPATHDIETAFLALEFLRCIFSNSLLAEAGPEGIEVISTETGFDIEAPFRGSFKIEIVDPNPLMASPVPAGMFS